MRRYDSSVEVMVPVRLEAPGGKGALAAWSRELADTGIRVYVSPLPKAGQVLDAFLGAKAADAMHLSVRVGEASADGTEVELEILPEGSGSLERYLSYAAALGMEAVAALGPHLVGLEERGEQDMQFVPGGFLDELTRKWVVYDAQADRELRHLIEHYFSHERIYRTQKGIQRVRFLANVTAAVKKPGNPRRFIGVPIFDGQRPAVLVLGRNGARQIVPLEAGCRLRLSPPS